MTTGTQQIYFNATNIKLRNYQEKAMFLLGFKPKELKQSSIKGNEGFFVVYVPSADATEHDVSNPLNYQSCRLDEQSIKILSALMALSNFWADLEFGAGKDKDQGLCDYVARLYQIVEHMTGQLSDQMRTKVRRMLD